MFVFVLIITVLYGVLNILLWLTWVQLPASLIETTDADLSECRVTVVIPVRNEAENLPSLLDDLAKQTFKNFEVIVADDASSDNTLSILNDYKSRDLFKMSVLALSDNKTLSPKKRAITESIKISQGELIMTTDGDCRVGPNWLRSFVICYKAYSPKMITGPVTFNIEESSGKNRILSSLQVVEFSSLIGVGACTLFWDRPTMCNGANLCYEKKAFVEVGGFTGVDHLASGDDELLMQKIAANAPGSVRFLKNVEAIVSTDAHRTWRSFYNQRKRWASKWKMYRSWEPSALAVFIFLSNLSPIIMLGSYITGFISLTILVILLSLKFVPEFILLKTILTDLRKSSCIKFIPVTQLIYPFYAVFFGLVAQKGGYEWKGRRLH